MTVMASQAALAVNLPYGRQVRQRPVVQIGEELLGVPAVLLLGRGTTSRLR